MVAMERLSLMIDLERCIGCKSCEAACKQEHGLGPGEYRNKVVWLGDANGAALDFLTVTCQHCERPACLRACPVNPKAIEKDPKDVRAIMRLANMYHDSRKFDQAVDLYRKALEITPRDVDARTDMGICLYEMGMADEAVAQFPLISMGVRRTRVGHLRCERHH